MELKKGYKVKGTCPSKDIKNYTGRVCSVINDGKTANIKRDDGVTGNGITVIGYGSLWKVEKKDNGTWGGDENGGTLTIISKTVKKPTHLVVYDLNNRDPVQEAYSEEEAKEIARKLLNDNSVNSESIVIYEIKKQLKPKVLVKFI